MVNIFEARANLNVVAQEIESSEGYDAVQYLSSFISQSNRKLELTKEYYELIIEFGRNKVDSVFSSGLSGYILSRTQGNYSLDAIKQTLKG